MYTQPELKDYQDKWLQAERELAIKSLEILGWDPSIYDEFAPSEKIPQPIKQSKKQGQEDNFTKADFMKALKKVSRPIAKPKSSPKPS